MNVTSTKRALTVARYEIRYPQARSLLIVWALMTIFLAWAMSIGAVQISSGSSGVGGIKAHVTSEFAQALQSAVVAIMIDGFFFAVLAGMTVPRDYESRVLDIERASGLSPRSNVSGKFLAAGFWLCMMLFLQVLARIFFNHVLPNASMDESRGPLIVLNYIRPMIFMVAPGLIFNGAMAFFLGARTKNAVIVFLSPVALIMAYSFLFSETLLNRVPPNIREVIRLGDPSGTEWLSQTYLRDDRGASFYNTTPIDYEMPFLVSRAALLLLSAGLVMASASRSMVESPALSRFRLFGKRRKRAIAVGTDEPLEVPKKLSASISLADLQMKVRRPTWLGNVYSVARLELKNLMRGPGLWLFGIIIAFVATINAVMQPGPLDTTILVTSGNFAARSFPFVTFCTCLLALFFWDRCNGTRAICTGGIVPVWITDPALCMASGQVDCMCHSRFCSGGQHLSGHVHCHGLAKAGLATGLAIDLHLGLAPVSHILVLVSICGVCTIIYTEPLSGFGCRFWIYGAHVLGEFKRLYQLGE